MAVSSMLRQPLALRARSQNKPLDAWNVFVSCRTTPGRHPASLVMAGMNGRDHGNRCSRRAPGIPVLTSHHAVAGSSANVRIEGILGNTIDESSLGLDTRQD